MNINDIKEALQKQNPMNWQAMGWGEFLTLLDELKGIRLEV